MKYDIGFTKEQAENISRELLRLSIGSAVGNSGSEFLLSRIKHASIDEWALLVPYTLRVPLSNCFNIELSINTLLNLYDQYLTEQEKIDFPGLIRERKNNSSRNNQFILLEEITPQAVKDKFKTYDELEADGWFPVLEDL